MIAGPAEATTAGKVLVELVGLGFADSMSGMRKALASDSSLRRFEPVNKEIWDAAYQRFKDITRL